MTLSVQSLGPVAAVVAAGFGMAPGAADSLLKNAPSGGNCSTPYRPCMIGIEANCFENVPSDQKHNLVGMTDGNSAGNLNKWVAPAGKGYT